MKTPLLAIWAEMRLDVRPFGGPSISAQAGSYSFQVCAVDYDGFAACDKAAIIVPPALRLRRPRIAPTPVLAATGMGPIPSP